MGFEADINIDQKTFKDLLDFVRDTQGLPVREPKPAPSLLDGVGKFLTQLTPLFLAYLSSQRLNRKDTDETKEDTEDEDTDEDHDPSVILDAHLSDNKSSICPCVYTTVTDEATKETEATEETEETDK